jgi:hypothetical protein
MLTKTQSTTAHLSSTQEELRDSQPEVRVDFGDSQDIRVLHRTLLNTQHMLESNLRICHENSGLLEFISKPLKQNPTRPCGPNGVGPALFSTRTTQELERVQTMLRKTQAASDLVSLPQGHRNANSDRTNRSRASYHFVGLKLSRQAARCLPKWRGWHKATTKSCYISPQSHGKMLKP